MDENSLLGVFVSWAPMFLLVGAWIYFMRKSGVGETKRQVLEEYKKQNELVIRLIERMDQRIGRLEDRDSKSGSA